MLESQAQRKNQMNWKKELEGRRPGREELFQIYTRAAAERFAPKKVEFEPPDVVKIHVEGRGTLAIRLENLWRQCTPGANISEVVEHHLASIEAVLEPKPENFSKEMIVPLVRDHGYLRSMKNTDELATEHLAGDVWIVYAIDQPRASFPLPLAKLDGLGVSRGDLRELAVKNLKRMIPGIKVHSMGSWYAVSAGNCYEASVLLLDDFWEQAQKPVKGDVVAAVPSRTAVLVTSSGSADGITAVRQKAREIYASGQGPVTQTLFRRVSGVWQVF
jgi:uncharacterized protein YtpQ (UPF0354 family)